VVEGQKWAGQDKYRGQSRSSWRWPFMKKYLKGVREFIKSYLSVGTPVEERIHDTNFKVKYLIPVLDWVFRKSGNEHLDHSMNVSK
jgi:hypothetical protein